ncbi:hypothetical protein K438DRAFT_1756854 [Mycena galopus ATCC 62051]|nr:hypothetical protein K438DRAFT_1756854 [Mycena galopus ATCC 62051]
MFGQKHRNLVLLLTPKWEGPDADVEADVEAEADADAEAEAEAEADAEEEVQMQRQQICGYEYRYAMVNGIATVVQDGKKHIYFSYRDPDTDADADTDMDTGMYLQPVLVPKILVAEQHVEK